MIRTVRRTKGRPSLTAVLVGVLLILLPVFAYLQYDWLGKVSESEREQMQRNLHRSADQFQQDFDGQIGRAYTHFQRAVRDSAEQVRKDLPAAYKNWIEIAEYPKLISDVFLATAAPDRIERFNSSNQRFESVSWPAELSDLRRRLATEPAIRFREEPNARFFVRLAPMSIDPQMPALFIPIDQPASYLILKLNRAFMRDELLPSLIADHFAVNGASDYNVAVFDKADPTQPIYGSTENTNDGDVSADFFSLRIEEVRGLAPTMTAIERSVTTTKRTVLAESHRVQIVRGRELPATGSAIFMTNLGAWRLVATHRAGSLAAAVGQFRRRNLAISGGILALLAGSVGIMLFSSRRAQRLARQQIEFVSGVSHELRTPLAVICSAGDNLADGVVSDADQMRQYGTLVRNEGRRLTEMVEQILDFAGMESGRKTYKLCPVSTAELIATALDGSRMQIREQGFTVETHIEANAPSIMADKSALVRAIQNLISNALKYSGESRWIGITVSSSGNRVAIVVEDKGSGISSTDLPHIFEPFYRSHDLMDAQIKGSGLGLSLVKEIVEAHGGSIRVDSAAGVGTKFCIDLPLIASSIEWTEEFSLSKTNPAS